MSESASHPYPFNSNDSSKSTYPGGQKEVKWEIVAEAAGITLATIIAGRLQTHGIPVRAWQEGAGKALGLTVGLLGTGYVAVPEEYVAQAKAILAEAVEIDPDEWQQKSEDDMQSNEPQEEPTNEPKWVVVANAKGITSASIIAGRLQANDIPAHTWEEGAGHANLELGVATEVTGTSFVAVPEEFAEQAKALLAEAVEIDPDEWQEEQSE